MDLRKIKDNVQDLIDELEDVVGEFDMAEFNDKYENIEMLENARDLAEKVHQAMAEYMTDIILEKHNDRFQELKGILRNSQNAIDYIDFDDLISDTEDNEDVDLPTGDVEDVITHLEDVIEWIEDNEERLEAEDEERNRREDYLARLKALAGSHEEVEENIYHLPLVGFQYHCSQEQIDRIVVGTKLELRQDVNNEYDPLAVGVYQNGRLVAYVKKEVAHDFWQYMNPPRQCLVCEDHGNYKIAGLMIDDVKKEDTENVPSKSIMPPAEHKDFFELSKEDTYKEDIIKELEDTSRELVRYMDTLYHTREVREVMDRTLHQVEDDDTPMDMLVKFMLGADISIVYKSLGHTFGQGKLEDLGMIFVSTFTSNIEEKTESLGGWKKMLDTMGMVTKAYMDSCDQVVLDTMPDGFDFWMSALLSCVENKEWMTRYLVLIYRFASLVAKMDGVITEREADWLAKIMVKNEDEPIVEQNDEPNVTEAGSETADAAMKELETLIGLTEVKEEIARLRSFIQIQNMRKEQGLAVIPVSRHFVFTGNPGTGKTTVARILAQIYKDLGVVKTGQLIETDRSGLIAEYVGQTAVKTNKVIDSALDGVLFIDEAYSLAQGGKEDYGSEAIATLLKRMEDNRDRLVVILAGYNNEMQQFIDSNPGLQSRFNRYINFPDYDANELLQIFSLLLSKNDFVLTADGEEKLIAKLSAAVQGKTKNFGNARYVRNVFEKTLENQAVRLSSQPRITHDDLITIQAEDI